MKRWLLLTEFHIGIDDTDSRLGGCTTYTAALLVAELLERGFPPADFPWLVRLNPNIPWKTRGNGALAVHLHVEKDSVDEIKEAALRTVKETTDPSIPSTDPAVVFLEGKIPGELSGFSSKALHDVIRISEARRVSRKIQAEPHLFKGSRGLVGALAAIGSNLARDSTYEIIAYRTEKNIGTPRRVSLGSVERMDSRFQGRTFNNMDHETGRVLICPHGPDPVLFGIRGEDPLSLLDASREVQVGEPVERVMMFRTNHGTDAHLGVCRTIGSLKAHQSGAVKGRVETFPRILRGGHTIFTIGDGTGSVDCAAYEPTGSFRKIVRELIPGDMVKALGGVRCLAQRRFTLNLEKLEVLELARDIRRENPRCSKCHNKCESMGKNQGYRCRSCGLRFAKNSAVSVERDRTIEEGLYIPPPRANRHLTKPTSRYNTPWTRGTALEEDPCGGKPDYVSPELNRTFTIETLLKTVLSQLAL